MHDRPDPVCQSGQIVQHPQGHEIVRAAGVIPPPLAGPNHDAAVPPFRGLADLHVDCIMMQRDLARDGDAAGIGSEIKGSRRELQLHSQRF